MSCPRCSKKIPFSEMKRVLNCPNCKTRLVSEDFKSTAMILFLVWQFTLTPIMFYIFKDSFVALITEFIIGAPIFLIVLPLLVNYEEEEEK